MGGLATVPDLPAGPIFETAASNQSATGFDLTTEDDLPLRRGTPVEVPDWPEPAETNNLPGMTRHFWRVIVAQWPLDFRQQWGDRANELQDSGLDWKRAERTAFEDIMERRRPYRS